MGVGFEGGSEDGLVPNERIVDRTFGGIGRTITWTLHAADGVTKLDFEGEHEVPVPVVGKLAERVIAKTNEREIDSQLANLKDRLEA